MAAANASAPTTGHCLSPVPCCKGNSVSPPALCCSQTIPSHHRPLNGSSVCNMRLIRLYKPRLSRKPADQIQSKGSNTLTNAECCQSWPYLPDVCCTPYVRLNRADIESPRGVEQRHVLEQHRSRLLPLALRDGFCDVLWPLSRKALSVHASQRIWNLACAVTLAQTGGEVSQKP